MVRVSFVQVCVCVRVRVRVRVRRALTAARGLRGRQLRAGALETHLRLAAVAARRHEPSRPEHGHLVRVRVWVRVGVRAKAGVRVRDRVRARVRSQLARAQGRDAPIEP